MHVHFHPPYKKRRIFISLFLLHFTDTKSPWGVKRAVRPYTCSKLEKDDLGKEGEGVCGLCTPLTSNIDGTVRGQGAGDIGVLGVLHRALLLVLRLLLQPASGGWVGCQVARFVVGRLTFPYTETGVLGGIFCGASRTKAQRGGIRKWLLVITAAA